MKDKTDADLIEEAGAYVSAPKSFSDCWRADDLVTELARRLKSANEKLAVYEGERSVIDQIYQMIEREKEEDGN